MMEDWKRRMDSYNSMADSPHSRKPRAFIKERGGALEDPDVNMSDGQADRPENGGGGSAGGGFTAVNGRESKRAA